MKNTFVLLFTFLSFIAFSQKKHGPFNDYYENGNLKVSGEYNEGDKIGEWKDYYETGELSRVYYYTQTGEKTGLSQSYFENGQLKTNTEKLSGNTFINKGYFKDNGSLYYEFTTVKKSNSKYFLKEGYYKEYFENGILKKESNYSAGELNGKAFLYFETGEKKWEVLYSSGLKTGSFKQFYKNGMLKLEGNFEEGLLNGEEKRYNEQGILVLQGSYSSNKLHGKWIIYDAVTGEKANTLKYNKGELKKNASKEDISPTVIPDWNIERVPIFPGCEDQLTNKTLKKCMNSKISRFIAQKFNTDLASNLGLVGKQKIYVMFKINKLGNVTSIRAKAPHAALKQEAIRVISLLPKMIPGEQLGKQVIVPYSLPIVFQVKAKSKTKKPSDFVRDY